MPADSRTWYQVLGVPPDASQEQIKDAFHARMRENHPDLGGSTDEAATINRANEILSGHVERAKYDRELASGVAATSSTGFRPSSSGEATAPSGTSGAGTSDDAWADLTDYTTADAEAEAGILTVARHLVTGRITTTTRLVARITLVCSTVVAALFVGLSATSLPVREGQQPIAEDVLTGIVLGVGFVLAGYALLVASTLLHRQRQKKFPATPLTFRPSYATLVVVTGAVILVLVAMGGLTGAS